MIVLIDSSTPLCRLIFVDEAGRRTEEKWQADRQLAKGLLSFLITSLEIRHLSMHDISGIGVMRGPGSFTGLRIGLSVMNTIASSLVVPIVGTTGDNWEDELIVRLENGDNDKIVLPFYGADARITTPKK